MTRAYDTPEHARFPWGFLAYGHRPGRGRLLVFLHGSGCDSADWQGVIDRLPASWSVACMDFRGHGRSSVPQHRFGLEDLADDAIELIGRLGSSPVILVGHSLGGMVAQAVARKRPEAVAGLVLVEGWTSLACAAHLREGMFGLLPPPVVAAIRQKAQRTFGSWPAGLQEAFWQTVQAFDAHPFLDSATLPVLELYGDRGQARPTRRQLGLPDHDPVRLQWLPGAGHYLLHERPEELAGHLTAWVASLPPAGPVP